MAGTYTGEVIKYFRRKDSTGGFEPISWIGSEQRFVSALRNSNINNLEEQFVLGTDSYTITYDDNDGNHVIEKSFCITDFDDTTGDTDIADRTEYYKVISTFYRSPDEHTDYRFDGNAVVFSNRFNDVAFGDGSTYPDTDSLYLLDSDTFKWGDDSLRIDPICYYDSQKDELYFIKQGEPDLLVLTKFTTRKVGRDGQVAWTRDHIENALNP